MTTHQHSHEHHDHDGHHHSHNELFHHHGPTNNKKALIISLIITTSILILEFVGGLITGSLALLSDSGHMLSDAFSLALSLVAITLSAKLASPKRTFGSHRYEILAALFNSVTLFIIAAFIIVEAIERLSQPQDVSSGLMIAIASIGLLANVLSLWVLSKKGNIEQNINIKSAYLHVMGDALGSIGAIAAGIIMLFTNWYYADPIISVVVALIILRSAWRVIKQTIHILMEGAPESIPYEEVKTKLNALDGVISVEQLNIWTITSNKHAMTVHIMVNKATDQQLILLQAKTLLQKHYKLDFVTIQIES